jgi:hypothetical protein
VDEGLQKGPRDLNRNWPANGGAGGLAAAARSVTWSKQRQWLRPALDHDLSRDLDQEDNMSATTTDQHAVTASDQVKAVDRLVGQMADLSVVDWEAG